MGYFKSDSINNKNLDTDIIGIEEVIVGGDILVDCTRKSAIYKMINVKNNAPPTGDLMSDNTYIVQSFIMDEVECSKLIAYDVNTNGIYLMSRVGGQYRQWIKITDAEDLREVRDIFQQVGNDFKRVDERLEELNQELDSKVNIVEGKDVVAIDNTFNSSSTEDGLSANCGKVLNQAISGIINGDTKLDYGSYFGNSGGYVKLSSGLIVQFGEVSTSSTTGTATFTFPIPFPNKCYIMLASCVGDSASGSGVDGVYTKVIDNTKGSVTHDYKNTSVTSLTHNVLVVGH